MIAIVDYGMGNLASVAKALASLGAKARITSDPRQVEKADGLILPGVGAFGEAMNELKRRRLVAPIQDAIEEEKPFLGLCLGLQLLFEASEEDPGVKGLAVLEGRVRKLSAGKGLKVPHMGWNGIEKVKSRENGDSLLKGIPAGAFMYFVHSYYADPQEKQVIAAWTVYGCDFPSVLWNGRKLWATQFHPEKSQKWGLKILNNFVEIVSSPHHLSYPPKAESSSTIGPTGKGKRVRSGQRQVVGSC